MRLRWTTAAEQDRAGIRSYIAKENPRAAIRIDAMFDEAASRLADFPNLGRQGRVPGTREILPHRSYRLVYEIIGDTVWVVRLIHTAREWPPSTG